AIMHRAPMVSTSSLAAQRVERFSESNFECISSFGMRAVTGSQSKLQTPNTREAPSSKLEARAAVWSLELGISLVFGAWFLVFRFRDFSGAWGLVLRVSLRGGSKTEMRPGGSCFSLLR